MSKITLNATTFDLISTLSLDDIKLLEKQNPDALAIKDKDGDVQFVVKTGGTMGSISQYGIVFANKTRDGKAVLTYTLDTNKPADEQLNEIFNKVGAAKAKLDEIEATATTAVQAEKDRKAAFIRELTGEADAEDTTAEG